MAALQRQRLQKVPDPIKYMLGVNATSYFDRLFNNFIERQYQIKCDSLSDNPNVWLLYAGAVPLAFATKSLLAPCIYVLGIRMYKFQVAVNQNCFFDSYLGGASNNTQAAENRETVLRAIYLSKGAQDQRSIRRLDSLEALEKCLDAEIASLDKKTKN